MSLWSAARGARRAGGVPSVPFRALLRDAPPAVVRMPAVARTRQLATVPAAADDDMEYEDYSATSQVYDSTRVPIGLESLKNSLARASAAVGMPVEELELLDTGCGTGNYLNAVKPLVGKCTGLEFNEGMLGQAMAKHGDDPKVSLLEGSVLEIPFEDATFDAVIMTQVLHHLTPDTHGQALSEIVRVLKPGGTFWISTQTPHQHMEGFWWAPIIPNAAAVVAARFQGEAVFTAQLEAAGLADVIWDVPDVPLMSMQEYVKIDGPFSKVYRDGDSTWSAAGEEELEAGLKWWDGMVKSGKAEEFFAMREARRAAVGQTSAVSGQKPL
jgi:ubiquinone/menaquinone biosynthesis C-methylase UbiE